MFLTILLQAAMGASLAKVGAAFAASIAVIGAAWGISRIGSKALESMARQPEPAGGHDHRRNRLQHGHP